MACRRHATRLRLHLVACRRHADGDARAAISPHGTSFRVGLAGGRAVGTRDHVCHADLPTPRVGTESLRSPYGVPTAVLQWKAVRGPPRTRGRDEGVKSEE